jgi:hypothetical protein
MLVGSVSAQLITQPGLGGIARPARAVHLVAQLVLFGVWRVCHSERVLTVPLLEALDALLTIMLGVAWSMLGLARCAQGPLRCPATRMLRP